MNNLSAIVGADALAVQGVDYDADVFGFLQGGDPEGSQTMADLVALVSFPSPLPLFFCPFFSSSEILLLLLHLGCLAVLFAWPASPDVRDRA